MCMKWWLQKLDLKILKSLTCLRFFNIEEFYQGWNFSCFWWNFFFFYIKLICFTYQNLCMTFTNIFGLILNFSTLWKSCVKEQWPKKSLFQLFWPNVMIGHLRPKKGGLYLSPWNLTQWPNPPDNQTIQLWHQVSQQFWMLWPTRFFGTKFRGDRTFFNYGWRFFS